MIEQIAAIAEASGVKRLGNTAVRLIGVSADDAIRAEVQTWSARVHADYAYVPAGRRLSDCKVLAMDMDSTLINIECIDEIAAFGGVKEQVASITEAAMRGEIKDFSESLIKRVAFLKGLCTISHNIGLQVLAEGVASDAELRMVWSIGFDGATGPAVREEASPE